MTKDEIALRIKEHPKYRSLGFVQKDRVSVVASWIHFVLSGLRAGIKPEKVLKIVDRHRVNKEFDGIPMSVVTTWLQSTKSQLKIF